MSDDKTNIEETTPVDNETSQSGEESSPKKDDRYPLKVLYCGVTGLPFEYCEFSPKYAESKAWWKENHPEIFEQYGMSVDEVETEVEKTEKKEEQKPKQGGKAKKEVEKEVIISSTSRTKKKFITSVKGLSLFNIKLQEACKLFQKKFAASASVQKSTDEIVIQGDIVYKIAEFIAEKWGKELDLNKVFVLEEGKKIPVTKIIDDEE